MHGWRSPRSLEAAAQREVEAHTELVLAKRGAFTDPVSASLQVTGEVGALKDWLAGEFAAASAESQFMPAELLGRTLDRALNLLVRLHQPDLVEQQAQFPTAG